MKTKKILFCCLATLGLQTVALAQSSSENALFYNSLETPQSNILNPALFPTNKNIYITLPNIGIQVNSPYGFSGLFNNLDTSTFINHDSLFSSVINKNDLDLDASVNILGAGFRFGHTHITLSSQAHMSTHIGTENGIVSFLKNQRLTPGTNTVTLNDGEIINHQSYAEIGIGIGHRFSSINLTVAGRAKLLYGLSFISSTNSAFSITQNSTDIAAHLNYSIAMASASALNFTNFENITFDASQLFQKDGNYGLAFDFGAAFEVGPFSVSASILNISNGIHWKEKIYSVTDASQSTDLTLIGFNFPISSNSLDEESIQLIKDQSDNLHFDTITGAGFHTQIPTKLNIGASVEFLKICRFGLFANGQWDNYKSISEVSAHTLFRYNTTATLGVTLSNQFEIMGCAAIVSDGANTSFFNPGIGIIFNPLSFAQIYLLANYISDIYLVEAQKSKISFGINILL